MRVLILEDEFPAAERLKVLIQNVSIDIEIVDVLTSVAEGTAWFEHQIHPDLIFADIQLSDGLSFEIFEKIAVRSPIIFTTSFDEYALKAFKVKSIDYLLKPIKHMDLANAIVKFREMHPSFSMPDYALKIESLVDGILNQQKRYKSCFLVKYKEELIPIHQQNIAYFYASNRHVCLVGKDGKQFLVDYTIDQLTELLDPAHFFHLNRQFIAHQSALYKIHTHFNGALKLELLPAPSEEVMVSRDKARTFKEWLEQSKY